MASRLGRPTPARPTSLSARNRASLRARLWRGAGGPAVNCIDAGMAGRASTPAGPSGPFGSVMASVSPSSIDPRAGQLNALVRRRYAGQHLFVFVPSFVPWFVPSFPLPRSSHGCRSQCRPCSRP